MYTKSSWRDSHQKVNHRSLILIQLLLITQIPTSTAFSTSSPNSNNNNNNKNSPWSPASWKLSINFGRESNTEMTSDWGSTGARLVPSPIILSIESESVSDRQRDDIVDEGDGAMVLRPLLDRGGGVFINDKGSQTVRFSSGAWKIDSVRTNGKGSASKLRFWLDLENDIRRNDVVVQAGRLYFFGPCWRENDLERGQNALVPIVMDAEEAQRRLDKQLSHETGDRRLDGEDLGNTLAGYKDMALLVRDRDEKRRRRREAEKIYPSDAESMERGHWPGTTEPLAIGKGTVYCKRKVGLFMEELHVLGRWELIPESLIER